MTQQYKIGDEFWVTKGAGPQPRDGMLIGKAKVIRLADDGLFYCDVTIRETLQDGRPYTGQTLQFSIAFKNGSQVTPKYDYTGWVPLRGNVTDA